MKKCVNKRKRNAIRWFNLNWVNWFVYKEEVATAVVNLPSK